MSETGSGSDPLVAYVREALQRHARGEPIRPTEICSERPDLAPALAEALGLADELAVLQRAASAADPLAGRVLAGRYRLDAALGRGAMGIVYRATDLELRRSVAVKILDARLFRDEVAERRFEREAELLASLRHAHVVAVHDRGRTPEGIHFLVMDLLDGAPLAAVAEGVAPGGGAVAALAGLGIAASESHWQRQCARWAAELAEGLRAAHAVGVVHRDVKPSNVFVTADGRAMLLDFGIAARAESHRLTATESTLGTPWYMAPEQVRAGGTAPLPAQDIYGLCATLYHLLAGQPPYTGDGPAVLAALQSSDPVPLRRRRPDVARDLAAIVERGMERNPARRYRDAAALAADLRAFLAHQPVAARPIGTWRRWLRHAARRPARAVAASASALLAVSLAVGVPLYAGEVERDRRARLAELAATVPPLIAVEGTPSERLVEVLTGEHRQGVALLGRILELDPDDLATRLFRAALHLDLGERAAAAADFARIAAAADSPYLSELARRYLAADGRGTEAVDCTGLPEPQGSADCLVAGFHELRNRHVEGFADRALELLERAGERPAARDLLLIALAAKADDTANRREHDALYKRVLLESSRLEGSYGRPTARILAMRGLALVGLRDYAEAIEPLEQSLALRQGRHGPLQNLGVALWRTGDLDGAERRLKEALAVRPMAWNTAYALAQVARDRGDFEAAYAWAAQVPRDARPDLEWKLPDLVGNIAIREAVLATDAERLRAAAARALAAFEQAAATPSAAANPALAKRLAASAQLARAQAAADRPQALFDYLLATRATADDPYTVWSVARLLPPEGLGPRQVWMLGIWLREQIRRRAVGNVTLQRRMESELQELFRHEPR